VEAPPAYNANTQKIAENAQPTDVNGQWVAGWTITDLSPDELVAKAAATAADVRMQRDLLLAATDWMALSDVTMTPAWAAYRQALRDLPAQAGFPGTTGWPVKP
jgi:ABC-type oligopeptide transport system substrate-binding subunit